MIFFFGIQQNENIAGYKHYSFHDLKPGTNTDAKGIKDL